MSQPSQKQDSTATDEFDDFDFDESAPVAKVDEKTLNDLDAAFLASKQQQASQLAQTEATESYTFWGLIFFLLLFLMLFTWFVVVQVQSRRELNRIRFLSYLSD